MNEAERAQFEADLAAMAAARRRLQGESVMDDPAWKQADQDRWDRVKQLEESRRPAPPSRPWKEK